MKKLFTLLACALAPFLALAQYSSYEKPEPSFFERIDSLGGLVLVVVFITIYIVIVRLVFSIPRFLKYQKLQTLLLMKIASRQGVSDEDLDTMLDIMEERDNPKARNSDSLREIYVKMKQQPADSTPQ